MGKDIDNLTNKNEGESEFVKAKSDNKTAENENNEQQLVHINNNEDLDNNINKTKIGNDKNNVDPAYFNKLLTLFSGQNNKKNSNIIGDPNNQNNINKDISNNDAGNRFPINDREYMIGDDTNRTKHPFMNTGTPKQQPYIYQPYTPLFQPYVAQPYLYLNNNNDTPNKNTNNNNNHTIDNNVNFIHSGASAQNDYLRNIEADVREIFKKQDDLLKIGIDNIISNYYKRKDDDNKNTDEKRDKQFKDFDKTLKELENSFKNPLLEVNFNATLLMETIFKLVSSDLSTSRGGYFYLISILKKFNDHLKEQMQEKVDEIDKSTNKPNGKKKNKLSLEAINEIKKVSSGVDSILDECEFTDLKDIKEEIKRRIKDINDKISLGIIQNMKYKIMDFFVGENYHKSAVLCKKYLKDIFWELDNFNNVQKKDDKQESLERIIESYGKYTKELSSMPTWLLYPSGKYSIGGKDDKLSTFVDKIKKEKGFDTTNIFVGLFKLFGANNFVDVASQMKNENLNKFIDILCDNISINDLSISEKEKLFKLALKEGNDKDKNEKIAKQFGVEIDEKDAKQNYKKDIKYKIISECCGGVIEKSSANGSKKKFSKKQSYEEAMHEKELLTINNDAFDDKSKRVSLCIDNVIEAINKNIDKCNNYMSNLLAKEVDCGATVYYNEMKGRIINAINYYYAKLIEIVGSEFADDQDAKKSMERAKIKIEEEIKVYSEEKDGVVRAKSGDEKTFSTLIKGLDFRDLTKETIDKRNELLNKINSAFYVLKMRIESIKPPVERRDNKIQLYKEIKDMSEQNRNSYENIKTREIYNKGLEDLNQKLIEAIKANKPEKDDHHFGRFL